MVGSRFRVTGVAIPQSRLDHPLPVGLSESGVHLLFTANPGRSCTKDVRLALPRLVFKLGFLVVGFWDIARRSRRSVPLPSWHTATTYLKRPNSSPAIYRRVRYSSDGVPEGRLNAAPEIGSTRDAETVTS